MNSVVHGAFVVLTKKKGERRKFRWLNSSSPCIQCLFTALAERAADFKEMTHVTSRFAQKSPFHHSLLIRSVVLVALSEILSNSLSRKQSIQITIRQLQPPTISDDHFQSLTKIIFYRNYSKQIKSN